MAKLLVICGPTATGKTALALKLARKFSGELVNADSRQVYRGMDIGTGKDLESSKLKAQSSEFRIQNSKFKLGKEYQVGYYLVCQVPIWLLDIVWPDYRFNVADYVKLAVPVIENIWARGKLPILVGGTGFYIKALLEGVETINIPPDWRLRKNLEKLTVVKLQEQLKTINPDRFNRMNYSDRHNPRRLIRAIEVTKKEEGNNRPLLSLDLGLESVLKIGLLAPREKLDQAIAERVRKRLNSGLLTEIENLLTKFSFSDSVLGETIAYKEWQSYFSSLEEEKEDRATKIIDKWEANERQYARRQMTWFGKDPLINWFRSDDQDLFLKVAKNVEQWYIKDDD